MPKDMGCEAKIRKDFLQSTPLSYNNPLNGNTFNLNYLVKKVLLEPNLLLLQ